jgi:tetratricopeptide (TPR) repeat protein
VADDVARHLVAAGTLLEADPDQALAHARYARAKASRLAIVREAVGLAAYRAGEWTEAIAELRAARRMGGGPGHLPVMADAERALGRPERALELFRSPEAAELDRADAIELLIVASGARRDLGEVDAAVVSLQVPELDPDAREPWSARLSYAYADALLAADRRDEAVRWFLHAAQADDDELTDAADRLSELAGDDQVDADAVGSEVDTDGSESDGDAAAVGSEDDTDGPAAGVGDDPAEALDSELAATDSTADVSEDTTADSAPAGSAGGAFDDEFAPPVPAVPGGEAAPDGQTDADGDQRDELAELDELRLPEGTPGGRPR